ncbi:MAG: hypothetical protein ACTS8S_16185 [Giesbergeria sp.]
MTRTTLTTRRKALKLFAGVPLLPLGTSSAAAFLVGCGGASADQTVATFHSAAFTSMAAPTLANPAAMATTTVGSTLNVTMSDENVRSFALAYQPFFITGDMVEGGKGRKVLAGGYYDIRNQPILDRTVPTQERQFCSDERTTLMGDDATNGGLFVFVADKPRDLSAGTLYVAKVGVGFSVDPTVPAAPLSWIKLGSATSAEIEALAGTTQPTDIFDLASKDPADASYRKATSNGRTEWLRLKPGMQKAAAFLETHRYAAYVGASMGFTKMEGTTVNARDKIAHSALQNVQDSMVKGGKGFTEGNGIALNKALKAGAVMALNLRSGQKDLGGAAINSDWMPVDTRALMTGEDIAADALGNTANPNRIGNPDNLKFSQKLRTLFIGEDSSQHVNNFLWAYHVDTKELSRIMSVPAGGESTGLHAVDEVNGWMYIMSNFQHAGDWGSIHSLVKDRLDPLIKANYKGKFGAAVGYLTGTPSQMKLG